MHDLVAQGKVLYWGTSEWSAQQIQEAYGLARQHGLTPPTMEQPQYNMLHRDKVEREFLPLYETIGLGTTIWSPLASGVLTGKYRDGVPKDSRMALPEYDWLREELESEQGRAQIRKATELEGVAKELGISQAQLAVAWCLKNPHVSTVLLGASRPEQLSENLDGAGEGGAAHGGRHGEDREGPGQPPRTADSSSDLGAAPVVTPCRRRYHLCMETAPLPRVILHLDMDAFYAAVEVREDPSLAGKPLIIGHPGRRGVVSTCSYEARKFGVHSAMPSVTAHRLCPNAIWRSGRMELYSQVSRRIRAILEDASPVVEPLSIDEAFLDFTGIAHDLEGGRQAAAELKRRIRRRSASPPRWAWPPTSSWPRWPRISRSPTVWWSFPLQEVPTRLWPMPVERLWGVGPRTAARLRSAGVATIGTIARMPEGKLDGKVGRRLAQHLRRLALGEDHRGRGVAPWRRSISEERTYGVNLTDPERIDRALLERAVGVARQLRRKELVARTVHLKVRSGDFTTWTRSVTLAGGHRHGGVHRVGSAGSVRARHSPGGTGREAPGRRRQRDAGPGFRPTRPVPRPGAGACPSTGGDGRRGAPPLRQGCRHSRPATAPRHGPARGRRGGVQPTFGGLAAKPGRAF